MAYERRRLSTESDKSSTSTNHSTESTTTYHTISPHRVHPTIPADQKLSILSMKQPTNMVKRSSTISSPAEQLLARTKNAFVDLNPYFQCSSLPSHWRKNKSLRFVLRAKDDVDIKANTRVTILAGNDYNPCAALKNNISWFRGSQAEFNDLRFLGASGRGKKFTLTIVIETTPPQQCTYRRAIKITVDGPRKKRELKNKSDANELQADDSNGDGESDNETNTSMLTDTNAGIGQVSSGLLLLAAAAEQKRKDEADETQTRPLQSAPMVISYSSKLSDTSSSLTNCLSPSSSLASQFSHSIAFSPTSSSLDDFNSRLSSRHVFLNSQNSDQSTPTVPVVSTLPTSNIIFSLTQPANHFEFFHSQQQRRDQQTTMVEPSPNTSSTNTPTTHVLCR
ncbi:unnamed protein product [Adineta ricciae]|uniref:Runt domain-containing protein n=1 Tax=Adineta ricciae TaxID=249248 RepID=A0A814A814_ADIRI|nr:unnamed protein product [Adineta ricciae]CAF0908596.1 unnamed protein product [Adineta ricciae]